MPRRFASITRVYKSMTSALLAIGYTECKRFIMARILHRRKPSFLWQALLILLPVAILATVGFVSLRRDKILAQHEAVERAQTIADSLLPHVWSAITNAEKEPFEHNAFQIDNSGELLF